MKLLTNEHQNSHKNAKTCYICKHKPDKIKKYCKFRDRCHDTGKYRGPANIRYVSYIAPIKISIVFNNGSNYGYHFIIKELPEEF